MFFRKNLTGVGIVGDQNVVEMQLRDEGEVSLIYREAPERGGRDHFVLLYPSMSRDLNTILNDHFATIDAPPPDGFSLAEQRAIARISSCRHRAKGWRAQAETALRSGNASIAVNHLIDAKEAEYRADEGMAMAYDILGTSRGNAVYARVQGQEGEDEG